MELGRDSKPSRITDSLWASEVSSLHWRMSLAENRRSDLETGIAMNVFEMSRCDNLLMIKLCVDVSK